MRSLSLSPVFGLRNVCMTFPSILFYQLDCFRRQDIEFWALVFNYWRNINRITTNASENLGIRLKISCESVRTFSKKSSNNHAWGFYFLHRLPTIHYHPYLSSHCIKWPSQRLFIRLLEDLRILPHLSDILISFLHRFRRGNSSFSLCSSTRY